MLASMVVQTDDQRRLALAAARPLVRPMPVVHVL